MTLAKEAKRRTKCKNVAALFCYLWVVVIYPIITNVSLSYNHALLDWLTNKGDHNIVHTLVGSKPRPNIYLGM